MKKDRQFRVIPERCREQFLDLLGVEEDRELLFELGKLDLLARTVVDGFINGLHRAPFFGASIDFAEHRGYVAGDDIRRVDWRLYARTDRFYVKQYEEESNLRATLVLALLTGIIFPLVIYGMKVLSTLQVWNTPLWLTLMVLPFGYLVISHPDSVSSFFAYQGETGHGATSFGSSSTVFGRTVPLASTRLSASLAARSPIASLS